MPDVETCCAADHANNRVPEGRNVCLATQIYLKDGTRIKAPTTVGAATAVCTSSSLHEPS